MSYEDRPMLKPNYADEFEDQRSGLPIVTALRKQQDTLGLLEKSVMVLLETAGPLLGPDHSETSPMALTNEPRETVAEVVRSCDENTASIEWVARRIRSIADRMGA